MCFKKYSKIPRKIDFKPNWGNIIIEGDSNVAFQTDVFKKHIPGAGVIAMGGDTPQGVIAEFPKVEAYHFDEQPIDKAYIQIGGNLWIVSNMELDFSRKKFITDMTKVIKLYKTLLDPSDILIAGLPFVDPTHKIASTHSAKWLPGPLKKLIKNISTNDVFHAMSIELYELCMRENVNYFDLFSRLAWCWHKYGREYWWDALHYDTRIGEMIIPDIKRSLNI